MAGPPKDIAPSELFLKLIETPRPTEVIDYPRKDSDGNPIGKLRIQVLTQEEHDRARITAHQKMKEQGFDKDDLQGATIQEVLGDAVARELLAMACLTAEGHDLAGDGTITYGRVFRDANDLKKLKSDEIAILFQSYMMTQTKYGPFESNVTPAEVDSWIERIKEGGSGFPLLHLPLPALVDLTCLLVERVCTLSERLESLSQKSPTTSA